MKRNVVIAIVLILALLSTPVSASAGTITIPDDCEWIYYDSVYDTYMIVAFNEAAGIDVGVCPPLEKIYGIRVYMSCDSGNPNVSLVINCESSSWDQHDDLVYEKVGDLYTTTLTNSNGSSLFAKDDFYAQICVYNWNSPDDVKIKGAEWLDANGEVLQAYHDSKKDAKVTKKVTKKEIKAIKLAPTVKPKKGKIEIIWDKGNAAKLDGYQIQVSTDGNIFKNIKKVKIAKTTKCINKAGKDESLYYFRVRGYKKIGKKTIYTSWSEISSATFRK